MEAQVCSALGYVRHVVDKVVLGQVSLPALPLSHLSTIPPVLLTHHHFNTTFCCILLHAWFRTVSSPTAHKSWRKFCLNFEKSFFGHCVCLTEYTICLNYHNHRQCCVTLSVIQQYCT